MLKRKIETKLQTFLTTKNKVLFLDGARQVGKTYILKNFQSTYFTNSIYINLALDHEAFNLLRKSTSAEKFHERLSFLNEKVGMKDTCIFLDEIQVFYDPEYREKDVKDDTIFDLITISKDLAIKYPERYVFSGSLLGLITNKVSSWPAGYCVTLRMFPLDFEEFCWANKIPKSQINHIKDCYDKLLPVDDYINQKMLSLFHLYILVGGMPEAVSTYVEKKSFANLSLIHNSIEEAIHLDIAKYAPKEQKIHIQEIYDMIPEELNAKNKRFMISSIENTYRGENLTTCFEWIYKAGVAIPVYNCTEPVIPLKASKKRNLMKIFHEDVGILTYLYFDNVTKAKLLDGELKANFGSIYENAVATLLHAHGFSELYYYNSKKFGEVDFLIEKQGEILPLEIKSGKDYKIHNALSTILTLPDYSISHGYVFSESNIYQDGKIIYLPIYMIDLIKKR